MPGQRVSEDVRRQQIIKAAYQVALAKGLDGLTVRQVAARARVSHGLVLFHYETKEQLVIAVLDWLLQTTIVLRVSDEASAIAAPFDRLLAILRIEMQRLAAEPQRIRLFFDFWAKGIRRAEIRTRMRQQLSRYREAFESVAGAVVRSEPERFPGVSPAGLAAVVVSFVKGCAVQAMIDPESFEIDVCLAAVQELFRQPAAVPS